MRDSDIILRCDKLTNMISRQANTHFYEALRIDTLMQLLLDKGTFTREELDKKFNEVKEDVDKKIKEKAQKPNIIVPGPGDGV